MKPPLLDLFADAQPQQAPRHRADRRTILGAARLRPALARPLAACAEVGIGGRAVSADGHALAASPCRSALSSCGALGWTTDPQRLSLQPQRSADRAALASHAGGVFAVGHEQRRGQQGFAEFVPDSCLINRYVPGAKMSLHQDKNETSYAAPHCFGIAGLAGDVPVRRV